MRFVILLYMLNELIWVLSQNMHTGRCRVVSFTYLFREKSVSPGILRSFIGIYCVFSALHEDM